VAGAGDIPAGAGSAPGSAPWPKVQTAGVQIVSLEDRMKPSTKDEVAGKVHEAKGKIKEQIGRLTNDPDRQTEGTLENLAGKIQHKIGQLEKVFEKANT
jgi:uncharacterized protein YjbJ (UPF0337 family)